MNFKFRLPLLLLATLLVSTLSAAVPFKTTTIVDGQFAAGTTWYTMQIGSSQHVISDNAGADRIALTKISSTLDAADLWCFVGNATDGYQIYNKQAGATKVLASSTTMGSLAGYGGTGGSTYPTLQPVDALPTGYVGAWDLETSNQLADTEGYFVLLHGTDYAMNNFGGVGHLAFWAEGKDAGSTVTFKFAEATVEINKANGEFTASNANKTWHAVWTCSVLDGFTLSSGQNNMTTVDNNIAVYSGTSGNCTHTLTAPEGSVIASYSFDFVNVNNDASYSLNLTVDGKSYATSATTQHVEVTDVNERMVSYTQTGANKGIVLSNYYVTFRRSMIIPEPQFDVFTTTTSTVPYRIPAIARALNGNLIAVADYRHSGADIGMATNGRIDIHCRISKDNGQTWGDIFPIVEGLGATAPDLTSMYVAFGDPCLVADRESSKVMLLTCSGNVSFPNGTRNNHQGIARFYSEDNGETWSEPIDISEAIYEQFDKRVNGGIRCMFIGSGKISQSSTVKVGDYYRLYCAPLVKLADGSNVNFVLYSDDFGGTWKVLGGVDVSPIPSGGDEPKADELPDGSILISSRTSGGRIYNIYNFTNTETGEGRWGTAVWSNNANNGTVAVSNSTNGEIMFIPVMRNADSKMMYLMLQSVPFGSGRANVGIYYKELESLADFVTPDSIAKDWDGRHQASFLGSAYSTMCLQADNTVAFLYEEETYCNTARGGYTIVYKNYSIEQITDSAYSYNADINPDLFVAENIDVKAASVVAGNNFVGAYTAEAVEEVQGALDAYKENPTRGGYEVLNATLADLPIIDVEPNKWYRFRNADRDNATLYLTPGATNYTAAKSNNLANAHQAFCLKATATDGQYYLYSGNYGTYLGTLGAIETQPIVTENTAEAGVWTIVPSADGKCQVICNNYTGSKKGLHLAGDNKRLVPWNESGSPASLWFVEPIETFPVDVAEEGYAAISLPFGVMLPEEIKAYVAVSDTIIDDVACIVLDEAINNYVDGPVVLAAAAGHYELPLVPAPEYLEPQANLLSGTLKAAPVEGNVYLFNNGVFTKKTNDSNVAANKVYYVSDATASSLAIELKENLPTAIEGVTANKQAVKFYDLSGRPVAKPVNGIYVTSDGKKVLVK